MSGKDEKRGEAALKLFHEETRVETVYDAELLRRIWPFLRPHRLWVYLSLGMIFGVAGLNLVRPIVMGRVVARAQDADAAALLHQGLILSAVVVGMQTLSFVQTYTMQIAGARGMADLRAHVFRFLQRLSLRFFDKTPVGRLVTRATNDVDAIQELFASGVLNALGDLVALVGIVVLMLVLDWRMSLIAFAALPVVGLVVRWVRKRSREAFREIRVKTARLNAFLNEQVSGMSVVQAYAREAAQAAEFDEINDEYRRVNQRSIFYEAILDASIEMIGTVCIASVLWWAGLNRFSAHAVTFPLVVTFAQYIKQFFEPVSLLAQRYTILQSAMSGAERVFKLLDETDTEDALDDERPLAPEGPEGEAVHFEGVTFAYKPGSPVLRDVSIEVARGERIALVGATGAGKSTVASILLRLYEHQEGIVRVLGKDVRSYDRRELRKLFSVVPQDVFLFAGSVASNVAMGEEHPDMSRVRQALERVGALDVFERRPDGLRARVDERGSNFSAGERQLLAFARAVYTNAPLLILDEATASIDSDTEARLQTALEAVMEGRTSLVIAHRLSTIRAADRIVVFHRGKVVEVGTHDTLIAKDGVYARLHRLQFASQKDAAGSLREGPASVEPVSA